jgi:serine protease inhibitor
VLFGIVFTACTSPFIPAVVAAPIPASPYPSMYSPASLPAHQAIEAVTALGMNLLIDLRKANRSNVVVSPYGVGTEMMLALNGAKGNTRGAIQNGLRLGNLSIGDINNENQDIETSLASDRS